MSDDQELLEFGTIDVFYIMWERPDTSYFLKDMSPNLNHIEWTKNKQVAFYLYTAEEGKKIVRYLSKMRKGISLESGEINILDDIDQDLFP